MTVKQQKTLHIPQGTESFYLEEAYKHRAINHEINKLFTRWGYFPAETPVFDFFDTYRHLLNDNIKNVYRLIDREGDLLMLRSDITLFLAKQMGLILHTEDLPVRVCYSGTILRHQNRDDISKNEFFQLGTELIGQGGIEADLEILLLLYNTFSAVNLSPYIHVGTQQLIQQGLPEIEDKERTLVKEKIHSRDWESLDNILAKKIENPRRTALLDLFSFIGSPLEFNKVLDTYVVKLKEPEKAALEYLRQLCNMLLQCEREIRIRIDLSEIGTQPYYTGIVFQAYMEGLDSAVASGGRYDTLLRSFGFDSPSVGFMILLRKIESFIKEGFNLPEKKHKLHLDNYKSFSEFYQQAQLLREKGAIAVL